MVQLCLSQNGPTLSQNGTGVTKWYSFVTKWYRCHKMVQFSQNGPQQLNLLLPNEGVPGKDYGSNYREIFSVITVK